MRRAPKVIAATVAGTAAVLGFHPHTPAVQRASASTAKKASSSNAATTSTKSWNGSVSGGGGTATGDAIGTRYGTAQVKVTVKNGKITKIAAVQLQSGDPRSQMISSSAEPILQQEALSAQTADVDAVSGATYTSASYTQSLQSALDKLGYRAPDGSTASLQVPG
jgi:uncharacterized protein with FMN-binding domain